MKSLLYDSEGLAVDNILDTIAACRKDCNWSIYGLAVHAGMKPTAVSTW